MVGLLAGGLLAGGLLAGDYSQPVGYLAQVGRSYDEGAYFSGEGLTYLGVLEDSSKHLGFCRLVRLYQVL